MDHKSDMTDAIKGRRLSYKFQRLAEKIRQAIDSGELSGKLPGERALSKRFGANAKTLSKALTDLAAEGLLQRSIGRGTYVKGTAPPSPNEDRWLLLCDEQTAQSPLAQKILTDNEMAQMTTDDPATMRPSFINSFSAAIVFSSQPHEPLLRDLVVRGIPVVRVGPASQTYSTHAVIADAAHGLSRLARELMLSGHRRFCAVEARGSHVVSQTLRSASAQFAPDATIDVCSPAESAAMIDLACTAAVCDSVESATTVRRLLESRGMRVPDQLALAAVGVIATARPPCTGWYVQVDEIAQTIAQILRDTQPRRPATIWLSGQYVDTGTLDLKAPIQEGAFAPVNAAAN